MGAAERAGETSDLGPLAAGRVQGAFDLRGMVVFGFKELEALDEPVSQAFAGEGIKDAAAIATLLDDMMSPEHGEVLRDAGMADAKHRLQRVHVLLSVAQFDDDPGPVGMGEGAEEVG